MRQLPVRLHLGPSGRSAPPWQPCTATASSCRAARNVSGRPVPRQPTGGRRAGSWQCPFHARRHRFTRLGRGRRPRRGFESFDYLIAADTKPIFLPLPMLSIVANISIQDPVPVSTTASFPLFFLKVSQKNNSILPIGGMQINRAPYCLCFAFLLLSPAPKHP